MVVVILIVAFAIIPIIPITYTSKESALLTTVEPYMLTKVESSTFTTIKSYIATSVKTRQYLTTTYNEKKEIFLTTTSWTQTFFYREILMNDKLSVPAWKYLYWVSFIDVSNKQNVKVFGNFTVEAGNDVIFYVFDQKGYNGWISGGSATPYVSSGKVGHYEFVFYPDHTDYYYFVLDNRYSIFTNKLVSTWVGLTYNTVVTNTQTLTTTRTVTVPETVTITSSETITSTIPETVTTTTFETITITTQITTTKTVQVDVNRTNYISLLEYLLKLMRGKI